MISAWGAARIVLVDDQELNLRLLEQMLRRAGYSNLASTRRSEECPVLCRHEQPDLVLLDLHMPPPDGFALLAELREMFGDEYVPVLVLTADTTSTSRERALALGANDFLSKPFERTEVVLRIGNLLETRQLHLRQRALVENLENRVRERTSDLEGVQVELLERLGRAADLRDGETGAHARRVGASVQLLCRELGLAESECDLYRMASPLHDVGKIGVPDALLLKPAPLTSMEFELVKLHTAKGGNLLAGSSFPVLRVAEEMARWHHERWDGGGYHRRAGLDIPLSARLVSVADVYDALVHDRPYKRAWEPEQAVAELRTQSGAMFEPRIVDAFLRLVDRGQVCDTALGTALLDRRAG